LNANVALVDWQAVTSLGDSVEETALLLRAGLCHLEDTRFVDALGRPIRMCVAPAVDPASSGVERLLGLARLALDRLAVRLPDGAVVMHIVLALPSELATGAADAAAESIRKLVSQLQSGLPAAFARAAIVAMPYGPAAGAIAMKRALALVSDGDFVIWGGVDSWHHWDRLEPLLDTDRVLTDDNVDGIRPGEAAAFALVRAARPGDAIGCTGLGLAREPHPRGLNGTCKSDGLTQALDSALAPLRTAGRGCAQWYLDTSHEAHSTHELQNVIARFGDCIGARAEMHMPLKELGDAGAASMPLLAALAAQSWRDGWTDDDDAVVIGCSDDGARGALLLSRRAPALAGVRP
jgi:3-oxoacyl-[acyl-carrier-protein] synthase I